MLRLRQHMEQLISFLFFMVNFDPSNPFQSADLIVDVDPEPGESYTVKVNSVGILLPEL
jgi:hypothetical protein